MDVLINKSYKQYDTLSRYSVVPYYYNELDKKYVTGTSTYLFDTTNYFVHTIHQGETYDSLSMYYYNNPTYYWVICNFNRVEDCFKPPKVGDKIKIPVLSNIVFKEY